MDILDLGITDDLIEQVYERGYISEWDTEFLFGLVDYPRLTPKQERKAKLILMKLNRARRTQQSSQNGDFKQQMEDREAAQAQVCRHCGKAL